MALDKVKLGGGKTGGAKSGHPERWTVRAEVKLAAKKRRRREDKKVIRSVE
jgi:hypothetical protein